MLLGISASQRFNAMVYTPPSGNVYDTLDSSRKSTHITLSGTDLVATFDSGATNCIAAAKNPLDPTHLSYYWEVAVGTVGTKMAAGMIPSSASNFDTGLGSSDGVAWFSDGSHAQVGCTVTGNPPTYTSGETLCFAFIMGKLYIGKLNGTGTKWWNAATGLYTADPALESGEFANTFTGGNWSAAIGAIGANGNVAAFNFGESAFAGTAIQPFSAFGWPMVVPTLVFAHYDSSRSGTGVRLAYDNRVLRIATGLYMTTTTHPVADSDTQGYYTEQQIHNSTIFLGFGVTRSGTLTDQYNGAYDGQATAWEDGTTDNGGSVTINGSTMSYTNHIANPTLMFAIKSGKYYIGIVGTGWWNAATGAFTGDPAAGVGAQMTMTSGNWGIAVSTAGSDCFVLGNYGDNGGFLGTPPSGFIGFPA